MPHWSVSLGPLLYLSRRVGAGYARPMNLVFAVFCIILFSLTVPITRLATQVIDPVTVTLLRLCGAGFICAITVVAFDRWVPPRRIWKPLVATSFGSVLGFSLLIGLAMKRVPGIHGAIALAAMPAVTAVYASLRDRQNQGRAFWLFCAIGTTLSFGFLASGSVGGLQVGDWLLVGAVLTSAFGYVEGGRLSRVHGGRRIMSWAILVTLPLVVIVTGWMLLDADLPGWSETPAAWLSIAYLGFVSQSLGMFLWFRVLAHGPMARVALVQLLQPFFSIVAAVLMLGETTSAATWIVAALVALSVFGAIRTRSQPVPINRTPEPQASPRVS